MIRRTRKNPLATARDLSNITVIDAGGGQVQLVVGGVTGPAFTPAPPTWSGVIGKPDLYSTLDKTIFVSKSGNDSNDGRKLGEAKATIGGALAALSSGGQIQCGAGTFTETAWTVPNDTTIRGVGDATQILFATPNATLVPLINQARVKLRDMKLTLTSAATASTLLDLSNSFRCSFSGVTLTGQHASAGVATFKTQIGIRLRDNAGDNRFVDCDINNFGIGVSTDTIMNYFVGCDLGSNYRTVVGGDATGVAYAAGLSMTNCTMVSPGPSVNYRHLDIIGSANLFWLTNVWTEGSDEGFAVGAGTYGPYGLHLTGVKIAATNKCLTINAAKQVNMNDVLFSADSGATPTELTINSTNAVDGTATNLISTQAFEIPTSTFPNGWTYIPRSNAQSARFAGRSVGIGMGIAAGSFSYYEAGNGRARFGYDGTGTIVSDAAGGRDVILRSGSTARDLVTADGTGVVHLGGKGSATGGMVKGVFIANANTLPSSNPAAGGFLYVNNGALTYRGSSGTVTILGPA